MAGRYGAGARWDQDLRTSDDASLACAGLYRRCRDAGLTGRNPEADGIGWVLRGCQRRGWGRGTQLRAVVYDRDGGPEVLSVDDLATPFPGAGRVLVEAQATSVDSATGRLWGLAGLARWVGALAGMPHPGLGYRRVVSEGLTWFRPGDQARDTVHVPIPNNWSSSPTATSPAVCRPMVQWLLAIPNSASPASCGPCAQY
jgi:hypothetical protein